MTAPGFVIAEASLPLPYDRAAAARTLAELDAAGAAAVSDPAVRKLLEAASGNSPYLARLMVREAAFLPDLFVRGPDSVLAGLEAEARDTGAQSEIGPAMARLRIAKRRMALALALADIAGLYDLARVTAALTGFADAAVQGSLRFLLARAAEETGLAETDGAKLEAATGLVVLAMGKHGARELNYSSDIDLIVFYEAERFAFSKDGDKRAPAVEIVKGLVKLMAETTADGYVFRVDLRLRPDAGATQIAISTEAAELYYESMGQNWERAAMIKARACAGDAEVSARFLGNLAPYIWRKYLDYAAIEDIHSIKRQIHAHVGHGRIAIRGHNLKLGRGGIREIEFFAQTQQLILGGRNPALRAPATLDALAAFAGRGLIASEVERDLRDAYLFLRKLEHRLQMIEDQQTHTLPKTQEGLDHVARFMGYAETEAFKDDLRGHLERVQAHYAKLFERSAPLGAKAGSLVFTGVENDPETVATLGGMGFTRAGDVASIIRGWHHGRIRATRSPRARELLTKLTPALLDALAKTADPDAAFTQFDRFLSGLPAGVQVFSLFFVNPDLLNLVAEIAGSAPRLAHHLGRAPNVLDALLDPDFLGELPDKETLAARYAGRLGPAPGYEDALGLARHFAKEEMFRVGVQVIRGRAKPEKAGPAYTGLAEAIIAGLKPFVEQELARAHGHIAGGALAVVALGKLGGREMTASSDLDLVFVYEYAAEASDGAKPLDPTLYFARAAHRFIAALTAHTAEGGLYDVDMRLRPSGNKGPIAVRLETFANYHEREAWTWERLALTRARVVAAPPAFGAKVDAAIRSALTTEIDAAKVLGDARAMREKIAREFPGRDPWDIKYAPGGLVDIEFVAQTMQLVRAPAAPSVLDQNTIAALEKLECAGVLGAGDAQTLIAAARLQHALTHVLRIAVEGAFRADEATSGLKALIARAAGAADFSGAEAMLRDTQAKTRAIFDRLIPAGE